MAVLFSAVNSVLAAPAVTVMWVRALRASAASDLKNDKLLRVNGIVSYGEMRIYLWPGHRHSKLEK